MSAAAGNPQLFPVCAQDYPHFAQVIHRLVHRKDVSVLLARLVGRGGAGACQHTTRRAISRIRWLPAEDAVVMFPDTSHDRPGTLVMITVMVSRAFTQCPRRCRLADSRVHPEQLAACPERGTTASSDRPWCGCCGSLGTPGGPFGRKPSAIPCAGRHRSSLPPSTAPSSSAAKDRGGHA